MISKQINLYCTGEGFFRNSKFLVSPKDGEAMVGSGHRVVAVAVQVSQHRVVVDASHFL